MNPNQRVMYYATSSAMQVVKEFDNGYWIEYNPNIKMFRLNRRGGVPYAIAGYSPHLAALKDRVKNYG